VRRSCSPLLQELVPGPSKEEPAAGSFVHDMF
jgi:hypothetical protein